MTQNTAHHRQRTAAKLIALFEKQIREGALPEGATLPPEREIVQVHGVSRTVAREVILSLANKGLVRAQPGFRPVVIRPSYDTAIDVVSGIMPQLLQQSGGVRNLFELRILLEASLVRTAAERATHKHIQALKTALAANKDAVSQSEMFYKTDGAFHAVLYEIPANPLLPALHRAFTDWLSPQWSKMPRSAERNQSNYEAHALIFEAILMRDPDASEAALRQHLALAWDQVKATFGDL